MGIAVGVALLALASFGCSGGAGHAEVARSDAGRPIVPDASPEADADAEPKCPPEFDGAIDPTLLVDDLEDRDGLIAPVGGRSGGWWVYSDGTGGSIAPPANAVPVPVRISGGRCGSQFAMRVTGQGFSDWGAGVNIGF